MGGYELHDQLSEQFFRPAGGYFANFSSSVGSTSEEIYSQQAVYFSYTSWVNFKVFGILPLTLAFMALQMPLLKKHGALDELGSE